MSNLERYFACPREKEVREAVDDAKREKEKIIKERMTNLD
ncbi:hypothetical protein LINPERPRIM_LOCUS30130, partial [Linum perenne]